MAFAGAIALGSTGAFYSDSETSTGNTFTAGAIDLKIDNTSYVTSTSTGQLVASPSTSWTLKDLTIEKFFNFIDVKPGDIGEDTISIHVGSNNAWMCAAARITSDLDNDITEPESAEDLATSTFPGAGLGELDSAINFAFWKDDGDNVLEDNETNSIFLSGPISGLGGAGQIPLSDSLGLGPFGSTTIPGGSTSFIGKAWCMGTLGNAAVAQDGLGSTTPITNGPLQRGTGFTCNGASIGNASQTDSVTGDLQFYAVQSRNNPGFSCTRDYSPKWPTPVVDEQ